MPAFQPFAADMLRPDDLIGRLSVPLKSLDLTPGGAVMRCDPGHGVPCTLWRALHCAQCSQRCAECKSLCCCRKAVLRE